VPGGYAEPAWYSRLSPLGNVATLADLIDAPPVETIKAVLPRRRDFREVARRMARLLQMILGSRLSVGCAAAPFITQEGPGSRGMAFERMVINKRANHCECPHRLGQQAAAGPAWTTART